MRRIVSVWLPYWPSERLIKWRLRGGPAEGDPPTLGLTAAGRGGLRLVAVSPRAEAEGVVPGMTLADARALLPELRAFPADPLGDARMLTALADWCTRFTPWTVVCGDDGIWLDVSGCAHLFGGEVALLRRVVVALRRLGFTVRAALADTTGVAWAVAHFTPAMPEAGVVVPPGETRQAIAELPVAALRLSLAVRNGLDGLGLRRVIDLMALPRGPLATRFGDQTLRHLDQALGQRPEPISPRRPVSPYLVQRVFGEPIVDGERLAQVVRASLSALARRLESDQRGARRLQLTLFRVDGAGRRLVIGTVRPSRDPAHLERLLAARLEDFRCGFGVESMILAATSTEPQPPAQPCLIPLGTAEEGVDLAVLVDRLANRLGPAHVFRLVPRASHVPERAVAVVPALAPALEWSWREDVHRPPRLFLRPEPIDATAMVPDAPPVLFRWRGRTHRVTGARGPERLAAEWWRVATFDRGDYRDYYRVEDTAGARFWVYRQGPYDGTGETRWYLHGLFA